MTAEKILQAIKNILDRDIKKLQKKVIDNEEDTFVNGRLSTCETINQTILNYEEMAKWGI